MATQTMTGKARYKSILEDGQYYYFEDYIDKDSVNALVKDVIFAQIGKRLGQDVRQQVSEVGLSQMHRFISADDARFNLRRSVEKHLKEPLLAFAFQFAKTHLEVASPFYIDHSVVFRIHYPHAEGLKAKIRSHDRYPEGLSYNEEGMNRYFRNQPIATYAHGPHLDTWFGHSYDGINLWWAIEGVLENNSMVMYPEIVGNAGIEHLENPPYLAPGYPLPKPTLCPMSEGTILAFNAEILHGTHLNITDTTRLSLGLRINPQEPVFDLNVTRYVSKWMTSEDVENKRFDNVIEVPKKSIDRPLCSRERNMANRPATPAIKLDIERLPEEGTLDVLSSDALLPGEKVRICFQNEEILLLRNTDGTLRAVSNRCPHVGIALSDGFHDDQVVYCPGHALTFDTATGQSDCAAFRLRSYSVFEREGRVFLAVKPATTVNQD